MKYLTFATLGTLNAQAVAAGRSRYLQGGWSESVDPSKLYPIAQAFPHNDGAEMRLRVVLNGDGDTAWLDIPFEAYAAIPDMEVSG